MLKILEATPADLALVRELFLEYAHSLDFSLCFQDFDDELAALPGAYAPPGGGILLAYFEGALAGCAAWRPLEAGSCEMKRLYVRPLFQSKGVGRALASTVVKRAHLAGYNAIRLDTVPKMEAAISMYRSMGFDEITAYCDNPIPGALFFERAL